MGYPKPHLIAAGLGICTRRTLWGDTSPISTPMKSPEFGTFARGNLGACADPSRCTLLRSPLRVDGKRFSFRYHLFNQGMHFPPRTPTQRVRSTYDQSTRHDSPNQKFNYIAFIKVVGARLSRLRGGDSEKRHCVPDVVFRFTLSFAWSIHSYLFYLPSLASRFGSGGHTTIKALTLTTDSCVCERQPTVSLPVGLVADQGSVTLMSCVPSHVFWTIILNLLSCSSPVLISN